MLVNFKKEKNILFITFQRSKYLCIHMRFPVHKHVVKLLDTLIDKIKGLYIKPAHRPLGPIQRTVCKRVSALLGINNVEWIRNHPLCTDLSRHPFFNCFLTHSAIYRLYHCALSSQCICHTHEAIFLIRKPYTLYTHLYCRSIYNT